MKNEEVSGRILIRNTLFNFVGQVIPLAVGVIVIPFIVRGLGKERFGILSLVWILLGSFTIFDLGLGRSITKFVAEALGKGEKDQVPRIFWTTAMVQVVLGILGGSVLFLITPLLTESILKINPGLIAEAKLVFRLLAISVPVVLIYSSFSGLLEASQRFDLVNAVKIPLSTLTFLITLAGVLAKQELPAIVGMILFIRLLALFLFIIFSFRIFPLIKKISIQPGLLSRVISFGGWVTVSNVTIPIITYLERFLIASFISVKALTFYAAPYEMISRIVIFPLSLVMTLFPAFSYYGPNDQAMLKKIFVRPIKYLIIIMTPVSILLIALAPAILKLWLGADFLQPSLSPFRILIVSFFLNSLAYVPFAAIQGLGRPDLKAKLDLIQLPVYLAICWLIIPRMELNGAALAKLWVTAIDTICLSWMAIRALRFRFREIFIEQLGKAILLTGSYGLTTFVLYAVSRRHAFNLVVLLALTVLYVLAFFRMVMDQKDWSAFHSARKLFAGSGS